MATRTAAEGSISAFQPVSISAGQQEQIVEVLN
jgi:hypothetical protein